MKHKIQVQTNRQIHQKEQRELEKKQLHIVWGQRRLNSFAYFTFIIYSVLIFSGTYIYGKNDISKQNYSKLERELSYLKLKVSKVDGLRNEQNELETKIYISNKKIKMLESSLQKSLNKNNELIAAEKLKTVKALNKNEQSKANQFGKLLSRTKEEMTEDATRTIASVKELNINTLRYKQEILVSNFITKQKEDRQLFLSFIDINNKDHKKKYQNFLNLQKIDLHKLKQEYSRQRFNKIKQGHI